MRKIVEKTILKIQDFNILALMDTITSGAGTIWKVGGGASRTGSQIYIGFGTYQGPKSGKLSEKVRSGCKSWLSEKWGGGVYGPGAPPPGSDARDYLQQTTVTTNYWL